MSQRAPSTHLQCLLAFTLLATLAYPSALQAVADEALFKHQPGLWQIAAKGRLSRWIEIHNLNEAKTTGVFHIEVLGHTKGKPPSKVEHVRAHMAITLAALRRSVLRPLKTGSVYPESFEGAYARWRSGPEAERTMCERSVLECL